MIEFSIVTSPVDPRPGPAPAHQMVHFDRSHVGVMGNFPKIAKSRAFDGIFADLRRFARVRRNVNIVVEDPNGDFRSSENRPDVDRRPI